MRFQLKHYILLFFSMSFLLMFRVHIKGMDIELREMTTAKSSSDNKRKTVTCTTKSSNNNKELETTNTTTTNTVTA